MADDKQAGGLTDLSSLRIDPRVRSSAKGGRRVRLVFAGALVILLVLLGIFFLGSNSAEVEVAPAKNPAWAKGDSAAAGGHFHPWHSPLCC